MQAGDAPTRIRWLRAIPLGIVVGAIAGQLFNSELLSDIWALTMSFAAAHIFRGWFVHKDEE